MYLPSDSVLKKYQIPTMFKQIITFKIIFEADNILRG